MILANLRDKKIVIDIISETFKTNPSVNITIGSRKNRKKKITYLASYAFIKGFNRKGTFLSNNKKGVAICYRSNYKSVSLKEFFYELRFAISIPLKNLFQTLKRETHIKKHRYKGKHLYFWFFGVKKGGDKAGFELKNNLYQISKKEQLPIILETSVKRNKDVYKRYGFSVYYEWLNYDKENTLWFMIRKPQ